MAADTPKAMPVASPETSDASDSSRPSGERDTLPPTFDLETFAKSLRPPVERSGSRPIPRRTVVKELGERYANGDYEGALAIAETVEVGDEAHAIAAFCAERCRSALEQIFVDRIGGLAHVPRLALSGSALRSARLDHRAGFVVSLVDGRTRVEEIVDASSMARFEALRILDDLVGRGIVQ